MKPTIDLPTPYYADEAATLYQADALAVLAALPTASVDALITDPPYSSGGMVRSDRTVKSTDKSYVRSDSPNMLLGGVPGDSRDQRGWGYWVSLWLSESTRVLKPGGVALIFTDWRQLPTATDALQAGGYVWRGIVPWHKPGAFPQSGRFAHSCEYVIWGTNGARSYGDHGFALPGFFEGRAPRDREHMTQKPLDVMRSLCSIVPKHGVILDLFAGSGTTGVASVMNGCKFIGVELTEHYAEVAANRLRTVDRGYRDDGQQAALNLDGIAQ